ncbi:MAG TPA: undecaprenyldiphospho-muramoylpentapeptide beta-N-acetylglucosaminyltransferase, partial [Burkholderiaceae bacterium]|nr:undecaprenyldiphospho-muramoylpentapeptide beta-N-acetylglucosaminyltransferase [Burkholderiaceae bacterium]
PERMEGRLVPEYGFEMEPLRFSGVRGKGWMALARLPLTLFSACWQAFGALRKVRPDVVLGMGGYVAFPGGVMAAVRRIPLAIHEQNAVAGSANRWLARLAAKTLSGFPDTLPGATTVGNPVRSAMLAVAPVAQRYGARRGPLRLLVVGGSLGAGILNTIVPAALATLPEEARPVVTHQAGEQHLASLRQAYEQAGVRARCHAFIEDMAAAFSDADVVICRAGAMTVAEVAAVGVAALFVPLPHAIDDHQTANARYLGDGNGAWVRSQSEFTVEWLSQWLARRTRGELQDVAGRAHGRAWPDATRRIADACEQLARGQA